MVAAAGTRTMPTSGPASVAVRALKRNAPAGVSLSCHPHGRPARQRAGLANRVLPKHSGKEEGGSFFCGTEESIGLRRLRLAGADSCGNDSSWQPWPEHQTPRAVPQQTHNSRSASHHLAKLKEKLGSASQPMGVLFKYFSTPTPHYQLHPGAGPRPGSMSEMA